MIDNHYLSNYSHFLLKVRNDKFVFNNSYFITDINLNTKCQKYIKNNKNVENRRWNAYRNGHSSQNRLYYRRNLLYVK